MKREDLTGKAFGYWTVISKADDYIASNGKHQSKWNVKCVCGAEKEIIQSSLKSGRSSSCGCMSTDIVRNKTDIVGLVFGKLTAMYRVDDYISPKGAKIPRWHCKCECGNEKDIISTSLKNGDAKSCGCSQNSNREAHNKIEPKSLIGKTYGFVSVVGIESVGKRIKEAKFMCKCICGNTRVIAYDTLIKNEKISCGCKNSLPTRKTVILSKSVIGQRYDSLVILEELEPHITPNGSKQRIVKCKCDCGNIYECRLSSAKRTGKCFSCSTKERRVDITGQRFGKLVVLSMAEDYISPSGNRLARCNCICDCGKTTITNMSQLVSGGTQSCGCLANTSGLLKDNKELMSKYDFDKNKEEGIILEKITARSNAKVWWKCSECGESWFAQVASQNDLKKKHGCPYCSGRLVTKGKNDFESQYTEMLKEWDFEKNNEIKPSEIHKSSMKKVWWKCAEGHSWQQTVANRTGNGSGCPKCNIENVNSFCEQATYYYIKQAFPDALNSDKHIGMELDIYIPSKNVAIEYDGENWHSTDKKTAIDIKKNRLCFDNGIELIRIREPRLEPIEGCTSFVRSDSTSSKSLNEVIIKVLGYLGIKNVIVDTDEDVGRIHEQYATKKYENSLAVCNPDIASEWHPTKNGNLTPDRVNRAARAKVWWLGKCGHEWQMCVGDRTRRPKMSAGKLRNPQGCPYCNGKRVSVGVNDLQSQFPEIAREWHPTKNGDLKACDVFKRSRKKVWWLLSYDDVATGKHFEFEWEESIDNRTRKKQGCPYLRNVLVEEEDNDFLTKRPDVTEKCDYEKNGELITVGFSDSNEKVWGKCKECNYEWIRSARDGNKDKGAVCPLCFGI